MGVVLFSNNASSTLTAAITAAQTTLVVQTPEAALFPSPAAGDWFPVTVVEGVNMEIMRCTARSGATLTVVRAQESTTAKAFGAGATVDHRLTMAALQAFVQDTGDTMTGAFKITDTAPQITLNALGTTGQMLLRMTRDDKLRWFVLTQSGTEPGGNAGSDFIIARADDTGAYIDSAVIISRNNGRMTVVGDPTSALHVATKQYVDAGVTPAQILAKLITVDGAGSGLDADLLDGQSGAYYLNNANSTGTLPAASLPGSAFTTDSTQTMLQTARKTILTDTAINQAGGSNFMMQSSASGADAIMTFHSPGSFATNFGMKSSGNFYKGGWSYGTAQYRFWDEQNIPLGAVADIQNSSTAYKLLTGAAIEQRNNEWVNYAISRIVPTVAAQPAGGVGTHAYLRFNGSSGTFSPGGQYAGSTLIWSGGNNSNGAVSGGGSPGGSWMALGSTTVASGTFATLFLRYA